MELTRDVETGRFGAFEAEATLLACSITFSCLNGCQAPFLETSSLNKSAFVVVAWCVYNAFVISPSTNRTTEWFCVIAAARHKEF